MPPRAIAGNPTYLVFTKRRFYFRARIPADLSRQVGRAEIKLSLQTADLRMARTSAAHIHRHLTNALDKIRRDSKKLTPESAKKLVSAAMRQACTMWVAERRAELHEDRGAGEAYDCRSDVVALDGRSRVEEDIPESEPHAIGQNQPTGELCNPGDPVAAMHAGNECELAVSIIPRDKGRALLGEIISEYLREKKVSGKSPRTVERYKALLGWLTFMLGDVPVGSIDRVVAIGLLERLKSMPANRTKSRRYEGLSAAQIASLEVETPLSPKGIEMIVQRASSLFKWAARFGYVATNYFEGLQTPAQGEESSRHPFTDEQLVRIFSASEFGAAVPAETIKTISRIALLTGMRLEEVCQLTVDDIYESDGIWVIDVNDKDVTDPLTGEVVFKKLKNKNARRKIPVHDMLLWDFKMREHVDARRESGQSRIFPELNMDQGRYGYRLSSVFSKWKARIGMPATVTFHSFRHRFIAEVTKDRDNDMLVAFVVGHKVNTPLVENYDKRRYTTPMAALKSEVIDRFKVDPAILGG